LFSCLIDADRIDTADFEKPGGERLRTKGRYAEWDVLISRLEDHLEGLHPELAIDHLRRAISRHCLEGASRARGTYSLTVPTGGGKTLASLRFAMHHARAHGLDRVIYFIPFTSIIDQNANGVRQILEPSSSRADARARGLKLLIAISPQQREGLRFDGNARSDRPLRVAPSCAESEAADSLN